MAQRTLFVYVAGAALGLAFFASIVSGREAGQLASDSITPAQYLQSLQKPQFRSGHSLLPLSMAPGWGNAMPFDVRRELAESWGWGLYFGLVTGKTMEDATTNSQSIPYKTLELARSNPKKYPLDVQLGTQNYFRAGQRVVSPQKTPAAYLRDSTGAVTAVASPQTPDSIWDLVIADLTVPLRRLKDQGIDFNVIQHWSEWFFHVWGVGAQHYNQDARVMAAIEAVDTTNLRDHPHYDKRNLYLHQRRAWYEGRLADTVKAIAQNRNSYNWYGHCGGTDYGRYGGYDNWTSFQYGVGGAEKINDYPGASLYRPDQGGMLNTGSTDNNVRDLLSSALASKGVEIAFGQPLSQSWVWIRQNEFKEFDRYIGYLKSLYVLGMVGFVNYLQPENESHYDYSVRFPADAPPTWLRQVVEFSRAHALFSYLDDFIRDGELIEGPHKHIFWAQHLYWQGHEPYPGYVLDNPYEIMRNAGGSFDNPGQGKVRVVGRQKPDGKLLVCAWSADDTVRTVPVTLPGGEGVSLEATPRGALYWGYGDNLELIQEEQMPSLVSWSRQPDHCSPANQLTMDIRQDRSGIQFGIHLWSKSAVALSVYTLQGRRVWKTSRQMQPGRTRVSLPAGELPQGICVIRAHAGDRTAVSSFSRLH